jgi:hypothetical protein
LNKNKLSIALLSLALTVLMLSISVSSALADDSPQYILSTFAVDSAGNPITAVITPSDGEATIYIAVTTQVPSGTRVTESGFSCYADGQPRVNVNTISAPTSTVTNANGSITSVYRISLMVPDNLASPSASFEFFTKVTVVSGETETEVTHTATSQLQYSVTVSPTSTPTPTATVTADPTQVTSAEPSPTVPEFPLATLGIAVLAIGTALCALAYKTKQTKTN